MKELSRLEERSPVGVGGGVGDPPNVNCGTEFVTIHHKWPICGANLGGEMRFQDLRFGVCGFNFYGVWDDSLGFVVQGLGLGELGWSLGLRVQGCRFMGLHFRG